MTMIMADPIPQGDSSEGPSPEQVRRGRRTALLLFAIGFAPMLLAAIMYSTGWLSPESYTNRGALVQPVIPVQQLDLRDLAGKPLAHRFGPGAASPHWLLLVAARDCDTACQELLYLARQVHIALGKDASRVSRAAALGVIPDNLSERWEQEYRLTERLRPGPEQGWNWPDAVSPVTAPRVLLIDPMGNIMMQYGPEHSGKDMLEDLKHLLRLSRIG